MLYTLTLASFATVSRSQSSYHQTGEIWARKMLDKVSGKLTVKMGPASCDQ